MSFLFLAPTGALEEGILCVHASVRPSSWHIIQKNIENEFLKHSKESRGVLGQGAQDGAQDGAQERAQERAQELY